MITSHVSVSGMTDALQRTLSAVETHGAFHHAHVREFGTIRDARQHQAHVGAWARIEAREHVGKLTRRPLAEGFLPAALHEYADADGCPLFWRIRLRKHDTGEKWIRPMRRTDGGGFDLKQPDYPDGVPLYRLPDLAANPDALALVVEGETCADALAGLALAATTSGGADSAGRADWSILAGRAVAIWPDFDDAGQRYAEAVAAILRGLGCRVVMLDPAALDLPQKGDAVDWLAAHPGATAANVLALLPNEAPEPDGNPTAPASAPVPDADTPAPKPDADTPAPKPDADTPTEESDDARIARLAALSPLAYDRARKDQATALGVRPATLDTLVKSARADDDRPETPFNEVEPWGEPVNPAALLSDVAATIRRFIILDPRQADAAALWVAFTWFADVVDVAPLAIINAPEKACGKSQLLTVLGKLSCRAIQANNMRPATLFRIVDKWNPALFIDECDTFIKSDDELPGLINAGHTRDSSTVWRCVGDNHDVTPFDVWGAKALAGIALEKHLPDATLSRAVVFNMRRKLKDERIERLRGGARDSFDVLASKLARFADDHRDAVRAARPDLPDVLGDRDQDNWSTLLAVAEQAGAEWVRRATAAALELSGKADGSQSAGNELLADIQAAFDAKHIDRISTADLIAALLADDEAAWATWNHGKPLTPRQLGRMLKQYGIASKNVRTKYEQAKGFDREQFADVFARYLNPLENQRPNVPNPESPMNTRDSAGLTENAGRVTSVPTSDVGRINPYRDGNKNPSVTLEPAWIKAGDGGTDESPFSGVAESAFFEDDDVEVF